MFIFQSKFVFGAIAEKIPYTPPSLKLKKSNSLFLKAHQKHFKKQIFQKYVVSLILIRNSVFTHTH